MSNGGKSVVESCLNQSTAILHIFSFVHNMVEKWCWML